jgi:hypothetical protein
MMAGFSGRPLDANPYDGDISLISCNQWSTGWDEATLIRDWGKANQQEAAS